MQVPPVTRPTTSVADGYRALLHFDSVTCALSDVCDENGVVVVPAGDAESLLGRARRLLETKHVLQNRLRSGTTIGALVDIDRVFEPTLDHQTRAVRKCG